VVHWVSLSSTISLVIILEDKPLQSMIHSGQFISVYGGYTLKATSTGIAFRFPRSRVLRRLIHKPILAGTCNVHRRMVNSTILQFMKHASCTKKRVALGIFLAFQRIQYATP
jgi:hypothetical protein